jgi:hypothetical protein
MLTLLRLPLFILGLRPKIALLGFNEASRVPAWIDLHRVRVPARFAVTG